MLWSGHLPLPLRRAELPNIVSKLLAVDTTEVNTFILNPTLVRKLCKAATKRFLTEPNLLRLPSAKFIIVGDLHGQFQDLLNIFTKYGLPPKTNYIFLGDMVDRGTQSLEVITLLMALKLLHPHNIFILRGNHESAEVSMTCGFRQECESRSGPDTWSHMLEVFNALPVAAHVTSSDVFCVHGGLSPYMLKMEQINTDVVRPTDIQLESPVLVDLLWADPFDAEDMWGTSTRGTSCRFGMRAVHAFLQANNLRRIVRGHTTHDTGFKVMGKEEEVITIISCPNYRNMGNDGAVMVLEADGQYTIDLLPSHDDLDEKLKRIDT